MVFGFNQPFAHPQPSFTEPVTPPSVDPDEGELVTVCFNVQWLPYVLGALTQLTLQSTWIGDDAAILLAQERAMLLMSMIGTGECSVGMPFLLRQNPSNQYQLEQSVDGGGVWTLAFDYSFLQGTSYPDIWDGDAPQTINPSAPTTTWTQVTGDTPEQIALRTQAFCAAISELVELALDAFLDTYSGETTVLNALEAAVALALAIGLLFGPVGGATAFAFALIAALLALILSGQAIEAAAFADDPDIRAAMKCLAYLRLREQPISLETFKTAFTDPGTCLTADEEKVRALLDLLFNSSYAESLYLGFVSMLGSATVAVQSGAELPACAPCEERTWCYEWTFDNFLEQWEFYDTSGTNGGQLWSGGTAETWSTVGNQALSIRLKELYIPAGTTVTALQINGNKPNGAVNMNSSSWTNSEGGGGTFGVSAGVNTIDFGALPTADTYWAEINFATNNGVGAGTYRVNWIRMTGTGVPLFGICDNC